VQLESTGFAVLCVWRSNNGQLVDKIWEALGGSLEY
jgi:hypothetical protein